MTDLASALRALVDKPFCEGQKWQEQQERAIREGAYLDIIVFEKRFVDRMRKTHGVPMFAHNMVRTPEEQRRLYVQGVTKAVEGKSPHNFGCAVDIVHSTKAWDLDRRSWAMLGHIGKELAGQLGIDIVWGGDWEFYDPAHWEIANWRDLKQGFPFQGSAP